VAAYQLVGFQPEPRYRFKEAAAKFRAIVDQLAAEIVTGVATRGGRATIDPNSALIVIDGELSLSLGSARAVSSGSGQIRWTVHADKKAPSDLTLVVRMDASNSKILVYYLLPTSELARVRAKRLWISNRIFAEACRYDSLDAFCRTCAGLEETNER
jgi:hypothetical protein